MALDFSTIRLRVAQIDIAKLGDRHEQKNADFIKKNIPRYEEFWRLLVFPFRTDDNSQNPINLSDKLPRDHETVCIYNYSILRSCLKIKKHIENINKNKLLNNDILSEDFDNCLLWLNIGYNQLNYFGISVLKTFILPSKNDIIDVNTLSSMELKGILRKYLRECIKTYDLMLLKKIKRARDDVGKIRNFVAHGPKFPGYANYIPKPKHIAQLIQWSDFHSYRRQDPKDSKGLLVDRVSFANDAAIEFYALLNEFWAHVLICIENNCASKDFPNKDTIHQYIKNNNDPDKILKLFKDELAYYLSGLTTTSGQDNLPPVSGSTPSSGYKC